MLRQQSKKSNYKKNNNQQCDKEARQPCLGGRKQGNVQIKLINIKIKMMLPEEKSEGLILWEHEQMKTFLATDERRTQAAADVLCRRF